ncbi:MAG: amino acid adenylation domain-containing protein [Planctomycetes bacterium]|nr:amino acid adenylation domain-containing protein [Planctomycetota bacterium]
MTAERVEAIFPLSPLQQGLLFHALADPTSDAYIEDLTCEIHGPLDVDAFERAWRHVVQRHAALRTSFVWDGLDEPLQVVHEAIDVPLERRDPATIPASERGYDLARPPLVRLFLHAIGPDAHRFTWSFHHALLDGWSSSLVIREVLDAYESLVAGREVRLPPPRANRDWMAWLARRDRAAAESFWRSRLAGFESPTPLYGARPVAGASVQHERSTRLSASATDALLAFGRKHRLTPNTLLLGAWAVVLARTSGQDDVVFGSTTSGRSADLPGMDERVGLFINTLPVRARVESSAPLVPWLRALQDDLVAMGPLEWSPLASIQKWSDVPRGVSLFDSIVVFENYPSDSFAPERCAGLEVRRIELSERTHYPLALMVAPGAEIELALGFDAARLDGDGVERLLAMLVTLLENLPARSHETLGRLSLVGDAERRRLLLDGNDTSTDFPAEKCVHELFEDEVDRAPNAVALDFDGESLTYGELDRRANRLAHRLRSLGVGPEARVAVCLERSADLVVSLVAILKAGGAYVPLDPAYPRERIAFLIAGAGATAIVTASRLLDRLAPQGVPTLSIDVEADALAREPDGRPTGGARSQNLAYVIFTSGSTGTPKGIAVPHRAIVRLVRDTNYVALDARDRIAHASSVSFDAATFEIWGALANGARIVGIERDVALSPADFAAEIRDCEITTLFLTTALFNQLASEAPHAFSTLRHLLFGGEKVDPNRVRAALEHGAPERLLHVYGPTESTTFASWQLVDRVPAGASTVPIGRAISNTRLYVLDRDLEPVPVGVPGELCIAGPGLARGYLGRPDFTAECFVPDPFATAPGERLYRTGDVVKRLANGAIEFVGRLDDQVKVRGFRIEPAEVATVLRLHERVADVAVIAREDVPGDRRLVAYVVARGTSPTADELRRFIGARLPEHLVPAAVVFLDAIPLNRNGKLDRRALPATDRARSDAEPYVAPRTPVETALARIWAEVLGVDRVGVRDGFFQLGGDSILTIQITSRAREAGIVITPRQVFEHSTVEALAAVAGTRVDDDGEPDDASGPVPPTPIQAWFLAQDRPDSHHFSQAVSLGVRDRLEPSLLERALERLVEHHDALRLRFERTESGWRQSLATLPISVPVECVDLTRTAPRDRAAAIEGAANRVQGSLDLAHGPLVRAALFDLGDASPMRLLLVIHHLVVDAVSWRILLEDLETIVRAMLRGEAPSLPSRTASFRRWAESLADAARSESVAAEASFWTSEARRRVRPLPLDHPAGSNREADARTVTADLDPETTKALLAEAPTALRASVEEVLLAALAIALSRWSGERRVLVNVEGHGRRSPSPSGPELDLTRTVGWFTSIHPVLFDLDGARDAGDALRAAKEQARAVPRHGLGWGLLRYGGDRDAAARLAELPVAGVSFNYLGQIDAALARSSLFALAPEPIGACFGPLGTRAHVFDVNASVEGGRLRVEWTYSESIHRRDTVATLTSAFLDSLRTLIALGRGTEPGAMSPSDFPEADLDQEELDGLVARLRESAK